MSKHETPLKPVSYKGYMIYLTKLTEPGKPPVYRFSIADKKDDIFLIGDEDTKKFALIAAKDHIDEMVEINKIANGRKAK